MTNIPLRSERHALEEIKRRVAQGQRRGADASEVRALLIEIDLIADAMLEQLAEGIHKNPAGRCGVEDPRRRAWCVLPVGHAGRHADSWGKRFSAPGVSR